MSPELPTGVEFRPMKSRDVSTALDIIRRHDDDDYEEAKVTFRESLEGQYVLTVDNRVVGSTGGEPDEDTDRSWWLSWTYLDEDHQGSGLGAVMLVKMIEQLRDWKARKVFVSTSDYVDLARGQIYRDAMTAYQRLGFEEEVKNLNFYDRNESRVVLGLRLDPAAQRGVVPPPDDRGVEVFGIAEIAEAEEAYAIDWEFSDFAGSSVEDVEDLITETGRRRGRILFASCPSDAEHMIDLLKTAGFLEEGRLIDFYEDGIDDVHFRYDVL